MVDISLVEYKITAVLIAIHWIPLLLSACLWPLKKFSLSVSSAITLLFTFVAWLIVLTCLVLFFDVEPEGSSMTWFAAYLIYAFVSLGIVPLIIVAVHVFAGRSAGLVFRYWFSKNSVHSVV